MVPVVATSSLLQSIDSKLLVVRAQPFGSGWIIWQTQKQWYRAQYGNDTFDYEEPSKALETSCAIYVANAVGNCTAECTCEIAERNYHCDTDCSLVVSVPDCDEVDDSWEEAGFELQRSVPVKTLI